MNIGGIIFTLCSATAFGSFIATVPLFYGEGGDPLFMMLARISSAFVFFLMAAVVTRQIALPDNWKDRLVVIAFGVSIVGIGLSYLQAVAYIPVSLAVMIFFTWPIVTALTAPLLGRPLPRLWQCLALLGAFLCLLPAIGPQLEGVNMTGVLWALMASLSASLSLHAAHAAGARGISLFTLGFWGSFSALFPVFAILLLFGYGFEFAWNDKAWLLALGLGGIYVFGLNCQVLATKRAVPEFIAIFYNLEPIVALFGAYILLGERLGAFQYLACAGVIGCLCLYCLANMRDAKKRAPLSIK